MSGNTALKTKTLDESFYSLEDMEKMIDNREHIFEMFHEKKSLGFISLYDLKEFQAAQYDFNDYQIRNVDAADIKSFYEHPFFQRRKPQLVSAENFSEDENHQYFLLIRGQKSGPYSKDEIKARVDKKEILVTELISSNAGFTWTKIYQMDGFDRRSLKENDELPGLPSREFFEVDETVTNSLNKETEVMSDFAYLGNLKRGKAIERQKEENFEEAIKKSSKNSLFYKTLLGVSVVGILYMGNSLRNSLKTPFNESNNEEIKLGEQKDNNIDVLTGEPMDKGNHNNNFLNPSVKPMEARRLNPIRTNNSGRSIMNMQKVRNAVDNNATSSDEEQNYYYNDTAPIELDPVRTQVSKETTEGPGEATPSAANDPLFNQEVDN